MEEDQGTPMTDEEIAQERADAAKEIFGTEDTAAIEDVPGTVTDQEPELPEETPPEKEEDPWEGVNPIIKKQFDDMQAMIAGFTPITERLKQAEKRIGAMTNEAAKAKEEAEKLAQQQKNAPTQEQINAAAETEAEWKELQEEFPQWAKVMDSRFEKESGAIKEIGEKITDLEGKMDSGKSTEQVEALQNEVMGLKMLAISLKHPDWETVKETPEFVKFRDADPERQKLAGSLNPADAIKLLDMYAKEKKPAQKTTTQIAEERKKRLKQSQTPTTGQSATTQPISDDDLSDAEYRRKLWKEISAEG